MKERIISALKELSSPKAGEISAMAKVLSEELQFDPFTLAERAKDILGEILHNYSDFAIGTIDSFTHRIVRAFAHDLRLPVNFEVETDSDKLIREAVDILIGKIGDDPKLTDVLVKFSEDRTDEQKSWQIERELQQVAKHLLTEEGSTNADKLRKLSIDDFLLFRNNLRKANATFEAKIISLAKNAMELITKHGLDLSDFANGANGIAGRFNAYANGKLDNFPLPNSHAEKAIVSGKWNSAKASASAKDAIDAIKPELESIWKELEDIREHEFPEFSFRRMVFKNIYALAVLNEIEKIIFSFRTEQNILHISEFNRIIARVVFAEPVPFIYERLGEKYTNYLIDEFQDTSVVQWQNLLPLVENALAGNNFTMLVGDGKQAIYRWRGGEVAQFAHLPKVYDHTDNPLVAERAESLKRNYREKHLAKNFRSKAEIVQFNNLFFRQLSNLLSENSKIIYDKLEQEFNPENTGGYVRVEAVAQDELSEENIYIQKVIATVEQLQQEGWQYSEICILTRTNSEGSQAATALLEAGIQVLSSESLLLKQSPVVAFMVAMLKCIDHPSDELAGAQALEFMVANKKIHGPLHERLNEFQQNHNRLQTVLSMNGINFNPIHFSRLPLYQRCEELIETFQLGEKADSYLLFFLDEVLSYSNGRNSDRLDFFEWWEDRSRAASVVVAEGMNAVSVMTIHKSKGLEFPVVILPFADWEFEKHKKELWVDIDDKILPGLSTALIRVSKELEQTNHAYVYTEERDKTFLDVLNVLYVAMTRAEQRLYIFTSPVEGKVDEPSNVAEALQTSLEAMGIPFVESVSEYGKEGQREESGESATRCIRPDKIQSHNWENRISIKANSSDIWDEEVNKVLDRGKLLHEILSHIETKADIDEAIETILQEGFSDSHETEEIKSQLEQIINLKELENCFSGKGKVRRETEILLPDGKRLRPNRVIENADETIILDYKSGKPNVSDKKKLDRYGEVLKEMGYPVIRKKIVYTESLVVESW